MTTSIELIFSGLLILSLPDGDGKAVVALPDDDEHQLNVVLLKGAITCGGETKTAPILLDRAFLGLEPHEVLEVDYLKTPGAPEDGDSEDTYRLYWVSGAIEDVPKSKEQARYLAWVPSLSPMVLGDSRLRAPCREGGGDCSAAKARLFLDRGRLSSCHLVHDPADDYKVKMFKLPGGVRRALADAVALNHEFDGSARLMVGEGACELKADNDSNIQILFDHSPMGPPSSHSHFRRLYGLQRNLFQRMDRTQPEPDGVSQKPVDPAFLACEDAVWHARNLLAHVFEKISADLRPHQIHSPTECGTATQP